MKKQFDTYTKEELEILKEGGAILHEVLQEGKKLFVAGITTGEIDKKVEEINTYNIKIKDKASKFYAFLNNMWIQEIDPAYNIGFENFKIERTNTAKGYGVTFKFDKAVNCWIRPP